MENFIDNSLDTTLSLSQIRKNLTDRAKDGSVGEAMDSFGGLLKEQMEKINGLQNNANQAVQTYASGGEIELHNVITAVEKADMALQLAVQVRNRLVSAYQEVSRMQI